MFSVELYGRVRHACHVEGLSQREAARRFGLHRTTVRKMLAFSVPPGYRRTRPAARPKRDGFTAIIDQILAADRSAPPKQRHTAKRIFERLRGPSTTSPAATPSSRTTSASTVPAPARCSCRSRIRPGTPRSTSARPWR
jgi:transcriptional regulator with XRE-family HTH domain